ncbi:tyrosine-protein kinase Fes/Fps-like [Sycon ciliatum]|uniref:tyrosine-protein kinase Fes/Fps-like n=1 Tax=Sycon ciliatum TaxID=27933 RepID=UPI0031F622A1
MGNTDSKTLRTVGNTLQIESSSPPVLPSVETVLQKLGNGYFGDVWHAKWTPPGEVQSEDVAVKVPNRRTKDERALLTEFLREGELLGRLKHPNVVRVRLAESHDGLPYIVMELVQGGCTLLDMAKNIPFFTTLSSETLRASFCMMGAGVAAGMDYLQKQFIVHSDLAARNILVMNSGKCRITDLGFTRQMVGKTPLGSIPFKNHEYVYMANSQGTYALPALWSAPETFRGPATSRSDVWSLGVVLWEVMSHGATPYESVNGIITPRGVSVSCLRTFLEDGGRLPKRETALGEVYPLMLEIWRLKPEERPSFQKIQERLEILACGGRWKFYQEVAKLVATQYLESQWTFVVLLFGVAWWWYWRQA